MERPIIIFGIRAIIEAITSGKSIDKIFLQKGLKGDLYEELRSILKTKTQIIPSFVPVEKMERLSSRGNHQGAVAYISPVVFHNIETLVTSVIASKEVPLFLLLDRISDVRNFGAIIRTAECTGVDGIIIQNKGNAPINGNAIKTSAGAVFNIPICKVNHIKDAVFLMQSFGIKIVAATEKSHDTLYDMSFKQPLGIIMGSEDRGISPSILKVVDYKAKLPLLGDISSLNVSVACGAFLYEALRQRHL